MLTVGSCFSGIGGLELGLEWSGGFETRWQIEINKYASAVLAKHWPNAKRYADITTVDGGQLERVDVICGGFPCQDVSFAGKRAGLGGDRTTLWREMFRLVRKVKPEWVVAENVPGLFSSDDGRFFGNIIRDLANAGYDAEWGVLSSAGVGAPHLRRRVFILAHAVRGSGSTELGQQQSERASIAATGRQGNVANPEGRDPGFPAQQKGRESSGRRSASMADPKRSWQSQSERHEPEIRERPFDSGEDVANASIGGWGKRHPHTRGRSERTFAAGEGRGSPDSRWWSIEPDVGRVAYGVPSRLDRLECLGNAVNPYNAIQIGQIILRHKGA